MYINSLSSKNQRLLKVTVASQSQDVMNEEESNTPNLQPSPETSMSEFLLLVIFPGWLLVTIDLTFLKSIEGSVWWWEGGGGEEAVPNSLGHQLEIFRVFALCIYCCFLNYYYWQLNWNQSFSFEDFIKYLWTLNVVLNGSFVPKLTTVDGGLFTLYSSNA